MLMLQDVRKRYGSLVAVDGLSLTIERGEIMGFLGPNGAGKSTSINMIVGLMHPDSGTIRIGDQGPPSNPAARRQIGVAPQSLAVYSEMSARENLDFIGRVYGLDRSKRRRRCDELLERIGLSDRADDRVRTFSGGMMRRLNLAMAIMHAPKLVLLDEPTAGVDPQSRLAIFDLVRQLNDEGATVLYTTHYMEEAQRLCTRVAIIDHGRILDHGPVNHLIAKHAAGSIIHIEHPDGEQRIESDDPMRDLAEAMARPGVTGVRIDRGDLETVFLSLTGRSLRD
ncbi:MAG: ABC transporter ATP-binding protein [Phycisphaeraceae bacterium]|nr:MAG: ABC transporter ATP-binding protein [Phycisphaeraceae bacterium]